MIKNLILSRTRLQQVLRILLLFPGLFLIAVCLWTTKYFGPVTVDQIISTVQFDMEGALDADSIFIKRFINWCIFWPFILAVLLSFSKRHLYRYILTIGLLATFWHYSIFFAISGWLTANKNEDYFKVNYVDPASLSFKASHPKSLVLIYVESLENTYSDPTLFGHDLLKKLRDLNVNKISFQQERQLPGTGWTMAGIVSTQCGIPLKLLTVFSGNRIGENVNSYLPNATCLGDILAKHGYYNVHLEGCSEKFAGNGKFYANHHYHELIGYEQWIAKGIKAEDMEGWGLTDDALFREAKLKLANLIKTKKLFNLSILTVNMHGPTGYLNKACRKQGFKKFEGIVECTANEVADFVQYVAAQGWLDKLNIVIMGDHLAMSNPVSDKLVSAKPRTIFNLLITKNQLTKNTDDIVHFDFFPTILDSLGFSYSSNRLGLGVSAIRENGEKPGAGRFDELERGINKYSARYNEFWLNR